jgi:CRP-like cAMP-binding protein
VKGALALEAFEPFRGLSAGEREELAALLEPLEFEAGGVVFVEGDPAVGLLLVAEGSVRLSSTRTAESGEFGPGSALGALAIVDAGAREATAETLSRSRLWLLRRDAFEHFVERAPRAGCSVLRAVLREHAVLLRALAQQQRAVG